jgi:hypothetical protein
MLSRVDFIAQQLKGLAPDADWNMSGVDRLRELAEIFNAHGITDLWQLKLIPVEFLDDIPAWTQETESDTIYHPARTEVAKGFAFQYYGRIFGYLGGPDEFVNERMLRQQEYGYMIAWSARGHGNVSYVVRPNKQKTALEIAPYWQSSSDAGFIRSSLMTAIAFFASVLLPVVGTAAGAAVGSAVVPASFAAAYPGITAALGNIAISTALNGGNVANAVKGAALSYVGGVAGAQVGGVAMSVTDSQIIANLADVAARTAIQGGDIKQAVGLSLINQGASSMFNFDTSPVFDVMPQEIDWTGDGFAFGESPLDFNSFDVLPAVDFTLPDLPQTVYNFDPLGPDAGGWDVFQWNPFVGEYAPSAIVAGNTPNALPPVAPTTPPPPNSAAYDPSSIVKGISTAALSALQVIKAYRQLDAPSIQQTARVVRPNGSVSVIGDNGLIQTRTSTGQVTATRPPVGVPQATANGNYVVNNGDGSYSIVSPTGQTARYAYSNDAPGNSGSISPWILGGGALLFMLAMKGN